MPDRYFDVGIAEQQAVLFAAGMALSGMRPVAAIYSTFLQRAFDQIVHDVCLQKLPVTFCMDRAGLVGDDGPTHHGVFDIAYLRCLPAHHADGAARRGDARAHAAHRAADPRPGRVRYPRGAADGRAAAGRADADRGRHGRDPARGRARRADRLRHRRGEGARRRRPARGARAGRDRRRRSLRQAAGRACCSRAGRRARPAGDRRGGCARRRLRQRGVGEPVRRTAR